MTYIPCVLMGPETDHVSRTSSRPVQSTSDYLIVAPVNLLPTRLVFLPFDPLYQTSHSCGPNPWVYFHIRIALKNTWWPRQSSNPFIIWHGASQIFFKYPQYWVGRQCTIETPLRITVPRGKENVKLKLLEPKAPWIFQECNPGRK